MLENSNKNKILIVSSDEAEVSSIRTKLSILGYQFLSVQSGAEGVKIATEQKPDIILLDMSLPNEPALPILKKLRETKETQDIPVILFVNDTDQPVMVLGLSSGAVDILIKPVEIVHLALKIQNLLELQHYKKALTKANEKLNKNLQEHASFLANISHDIRTPLNGIIGFTDLLIHNREDVDITEYLKIIKKSGAHLLSLVNDVLDISKLNAEQLRLERIPFSLYELVNSIAPCINTLISQRGVSVDLKINFADNIGQNIYGDPLRIRQILSNLLGNAVKFTDSGTISLDITQDESDRLEFCVSDTGVGIPEKIIDDIFKPYRQADVTTARHFGGTGLGLSISSKLVKLLGGELQVESRTGARSGSRFYFSIPYEETSDNSAEKEVTDECNEESNLNKKDIYQGAKILLVEDDLTNQKLAQRILEIAGYTVISAGDGNKAVQAYEADLTIDLILMDMQMPVMDGISATRVIRELEVQKNAKRKVPILALSASVMEKEKNAFKEAGINDFLTKPLIRKDLLSAIKKYLCYS